jgi:hypothetical protein
MHERDPGAGLPSLFEGPTFLTAVLLRLFGGGSEAEQVE